MYSKSFFFVLSIKQGRICTSAFHHFQESQSKVSYLEKNLPPFLTFSLLRGVSQINL